MKKIRLFSTKAIKDIEGDKAELYVNFYLVLNRTYIFTFLIDAPDLSCTDRHPIKLWKHFLIMLEEETVKYMRRYETCRKCGYEYIEHEQTETIRIPFVEPEVNQANLVTQINNNACDKCSNNPKNGGSGICHCTLGGRTITC